MTAFNFDTWAALASNSPLEFESQRRKTLDDLIEKSDYARRLRGLQFQIDQERCRSHAALGSCVHLYGMMWDAFADLNLKLNNFDNDSLQPSSSQQSQNNIIPFDRNHKHS